VSGEAPSAYPLEQLAPCAPPPPPGSRARLIAEATAEAARIRELARAEGHAEGLAAGREDGLADARAAAQALRAALADLQRQSAEHADAVERDAVELALTLSTKIVSGALDVQPERVLDVVTGALRRITDRRRVALLVNAEDLELVTGAIAGLTAQTGGVELCDVQADRRVGRGGAVVRTHEREVDASIQAQLERAREVVAIELGREEAPA